MEKSIKYPGCVAIFKADPVEFVFPARQKSFEGMANDHVVNRTDFICLFETGKKVISNGVNIIHGHSHEKTHAFKRTSKVRRPTFGWPFEQKKIIQIF